MQVTSKNPVPKDSVRRILTAAGVTVPDKEAFWLGYHMERFVNYTRKHGELLDLSVASEAYVAFAHQGRAQDWQLAQLKQALILFARGTERWRWTRPAHNEVSGGPMAGPQGWILRYRVKTSGINIGLVSAVGEVAPAGPPVELETWLEELKRAVRINHYSIRTEQAYMEQVRRFLLFTGPISAEELGETHVRRFLEYLAINRRVAASTQNQAFSALLFFFKRVLAKELGDLTETVRAKRGRRLPEVLSREEVRSFLAMTEGTSGLMLRLLYGAGLRLMECIRLRVKEVDFERGTVFVRNGKGDKDRVVMLPEALRAPLVQHFERLRVLWNQDRAAGVDGVWLPDALDKKYPNAGKEWGWQWVFPAKNVAVDPRSGKLRRHHVSDNSLHKAVKAAAARAGIAKPVSAHTLRHCVLRSPLRSASGPALNANRGLTIYALLRSVVCHAFIGGGDGYSDGSGATRTCERGNHADLHPRHAEAGAGCAESAGWVASRSDD